MGGLAPVSGPCGDKTGQKQDERRAIHLDFLCFSP